jgi:SpoVK/Ycf46/Vps4 family AAA+-type ATPase
VLVFDEADALFGKRTGVRDSSDRYANVETSALLQRLDAFDGLVILTSNARDRIDPACLRRCHAVLHFPRPGPVERRRIWKTALPADARLAADVDVDRLARADLTGGGIVGAAATAALLAAEAAGGDRDETVITRVHLETAMSRQTKSGPPG